MTTINANEIALCIESFGDGDAPLVLLAGGTTMLSWPDALCERLAAGGRRVVRYDPCPVNPRLLPSALHVERRSHHDSAATNQLEHSRPHDPTSKIMTYGWSTNRK
jgi:hypothetical protein